LREIKGALTIARRAEKDGPTPLKGMAEEAQPSNMERKGKKTGGGKREGHGKIVRMVPIHGLRRLLGPVDRNVGREEKGEIKLKQGEKTSCGSRVIEGKKPGVKGGEACSPESRNVSKKKHRKKKSRSQTEKGGRSLKKKTAPGGRPKRGCSDEMRLSEKGREQNCEMRRQGNF